MKYKTTSKFQKIPRELWNEKSNITLLYCYVAAHSKLPEGLSKSLKTIAKETRQSQHTISTNLKLLEQKGLIYKKVKKRGYLIKHYWRVYENEIKQTTKIDRDIINIDGDKNLLSFYLMIKPSITRQELHQRSPFKKTYTNKLIRELKQRLLIIETEDRILIAASKPGLFLFLSRGHTEAIDSKGFTEDAGASLNFKGPKPVFELLAATYKAFLKEKGIDIPIRPSDMANIPRMLVPKAVSNLSLQSFEVDASFVADALILFRKIFRNPWYQSTSKHLSVLLGYRNQLAKLLRKHQYDYWDNIYHIAYIPPSKHIFNSDTTTEPEPTPQIDTVDEDFSDDIEQALSAPPKVIISLEEIKAQLKPDETPKDDAYINDDWINNDND